MGMLVLWLIQLLLQEQGSYAMAEILWSPSCSSSQKVFIEPVHDAVTTMHHATSQIHSPAFAIHRLGILS